MSKRTSGIGLTGLAGLATLAVLSIVPAAAWGQTYSGVLTWHNDNQRTGQYLNETILTPANVNKSQFGKLFTYTVDGQIYAQPLYVSNVTIVGSGVHNVVYVATENDSVYAFDADGLDTAPLWQASFIDPSNGVTPVPCTDAGSGGCTSISPQIGITGTPVIDGTTGTLYVVAFTKENGEYIYRLHALDITSGAEKFGGPVVIQASASGTGSGSIGGVITLDALNQDQRTALLLSNGVVYMGFATMAAAPWHGWILGYDAQTLAQVTVYNDTANGKNGGIWASGNGLAADASGAVYTATGDGTFDANTGGIDYGDSFVKFNATGGLSVADYFTPDNQLNMAEHDLDLGSGGPLLLPTQPGPYAEELVGAGKQGLIYLVNREDMGGYSSTTNNNIQTITTTTSGFWSSPAYWRNAIYYSGVKGYLSRYTITNGLLSTTPASQSPMAFTYPGNTPSISSNGASNGIVWVIQNGGRPSGGPAAIVRAFVAANVSKVLYGSNQAGKRDVPGPGTKFSVPTIANGKVYIGTQTDLDIYGLLP